MKLTNEVIMHTPDCCFQDKKNRRFRLRAAGIVIENGCVLFATNESAPFYYSIGGCIHLGESAEQAVVREVMEETGIPYEIDRLVFVHESFFKRDDGVLKGVSCHEITFYNPHLKPRVLTRGWSFLNLRAIVGSWNISKVRITSTTAVTT